MQLQIRGKLKRRKLTPQMLKVMKLTFVLLTAAFLQVSAEGSSQLVTYSCNNASMETVFDAIKKQTGFVFFYDKADIIKSKPVSFDLKNVPLEEALDETFRNQPLGFNLVGKTIVVIPKEGFQPEETLSPPPVDVKGRIVNEAGEPVIASVMVKGTKIGTTTNANGEFELKGVDEDAVLVVSGVSIEPMEVKVDGKNNLVINVKTEITSLQEVVINKGYYTEKQKYSVGNVGRVTAKEIERQNVNNPLLALQGRVPGLTVTQTSGLPGAGVVVRIQGQNSLQNGNSPLYVVDGVPIAVEIPVPNNSNFTPFPNSGESYLRQGYIGRGNVLNFLNPADIESIEILKDADATSIYGSRAANGAILITTKKGKLGKSSFNLDIQQGFAQMSRFMDLLNTPQYLEMRKEAIENDGLTVLLQDPSLNQYWPDVTVYDSTRQTNWQKELLGNKAKYMHANFSLSGGNSLVQYLFGGGYHKETTVFPGNFSNQRGSFHLSLNNNNEVKNRLHFRISTNYAIDDNKLPRRDLTEIALALAPNAPKLYHDDGSLNWQLDSIGITNFVNPLAKLIYETYASKTNNLIVNGTLSYDISPGLKISTGIGFTNLQSRDIQKNMLLAIRPERRNDPSYPRNAIYGDSKSNTWNVEPQLSYKKSLKKGQIDALIGTSFQRSNKLASYLYGEGFNGDQVMSNPQAASFLNIAGYLESIYKYNAVYTRFNYSHNNKYILNITGRRDGSTRFGENNKFHNFWSVGGGWIFSEEKIISNNLSFLSFGKLKASYGTTGSDQIGDYRFLTLFNNINVSIPYQGTSNLSTGAIPNPYLEWEETKKLNLGIDLGFVNNRIYVTANYSNNRSSNQFLEYSLPAITGRTDILTNLGALIENKNYEFSIRTENFKNKKLNWSTDLNLTFTRNKLVSFPDLENSPYKQIYIPGQPVNVRRLYHYSGVDPATGLYTFIDRDGNKTSTPAQDDANVFFTDFPKLYGGLQNSFGWGGFHLDFLFHFVKKNGISPSFGIGTYPGDFNSATVGGNQPVSVMDRWKRPGDNVSIQKFSFIDQDVQSNFWNAMASDRYHVDASYIRLKNISLSWELPFSWIQKAHLKTCRIYVQAQNLFTITNYKGLDPETQGYSILPPLRAVTFGLQIKL